VTISWLLYIASVLIWGSTWIAIEFQLGSVPVEVSLVYRYLLAAALLFGWCLVVRRRLWFGLRAHGYFMALGLLLFGLNYVAAYSAQIYITSALNAIVFSAMVWMNIINARLFLGTRIDRATWVGAALGITGIVILFWPQVKDLGFSDTTVIGVSFSVCGALLASFGNIVAQSAQKLHLPVVQTNAWGMLYGGLLNALFAVVQGKAFVFDPSPVYVASLLYLSVFGSVIAFGCYLTLLGRIGAHRAGYVVIMFPIVAVIFSTLFEGMELHPHIFVGTTVALLGNLFVLLRMKSR